MVIYEWLAGERPFQGSVSEVVARQLAVPPPPLREKVPNIPVAAEEVLLRALAKDPKQRFPSVSDCAQSLQQGSQGGAAMFYAPTRQISPSAPSQASTGLPPTIPVGGQHVSPAETLPGGSQPQWGIPGGAQPQPGVPYGPYGAQSGPPNVPGAPAWPPQGPAGPFYVPALAPPAPPNRNRKWLVIGGALVALLLIVAVGSVALGFAGGLSGSKASNPTSTPGIAASSTVGPNSTATAPSSPTQTSSPSVVNFQVSQSNFDQSCGAGPLDALRVLLNNSGSTVSVDWQVQISDTDPAQTFWAVASPTSGTVAAGQQDTLTITPRSFLCNDLQNSSTTTFTVTITYTAEGQGQQSITISDVVTPVAP